MDISIRQERPEDVAEIARVIDAAFGDTETSAFTEALRKRPDERIPDLAWMAVRLRAYDPTIRGRVVYPAFFPPPPPDA